MHVVSPDFIDEAASFFELRRVVNLSSRVSILHMNWAKANEKLSVRGVSVVAEYISSVLISSRIRYLRQSTCIVIVLSGSFIQSVTPTSTYSHSSMIIRSKSGLTILVYSHGVNSGCGGASAFTLSKARVLSMRYFDAISSVIGILKNKAIH